MTVDLHMHTYYSDGRPSPQALVEHAASIGLKTIAITDHDNTRGSVEARPFAEAAGIDLIPAVEITTRWEGLSDRVDLLAYFVDFEHAGLQTLLANAMDDLRLRIMLACEMLTLRDYPIIYKDVLAENPRFAGAVQLIFALQTKGYVPDFSAGLKLFLSAWEEVRPCKLTVVDAIRTVKAAGGVAVLAHPTRIRDKWLTVAEVQPLVDAGLGGIEVYHHSLDAAARAHFAEIGRTLDIAITGGSDEHGRPDGFPRLGTEPVTIAMLDALRAKAG